MELGIYSFVETPPGPPEGWAERTRVRFAQMLEEAELADRLGLDVFGIGEHHRADFGASAPPVMLAAVAARTKRIRLTSAVTVLSSDDPVRVYQQFATLDLLSNGRAEIMAGRGSFIESFPLFGFNLNQYDDLFAERLELLLAIREKERVTWKGQLRAPLDNQPVYPRALQNPLPVWIAVGGTPESADSRSGLRRWCISIARLRPRAGMTRRRFPSASTRMASSPIRRKRRPKRSIPPIVSPWTASGASEAGRRATARNSITAWPSMGTSLSGRPTR
jgi:alkanesulfonate monooxygenase SsuD/methylene tetrahydromethanopterin reductase-like flavin-dependent oxidoreductase (luciferase family)